MDFKNIHDIDTRIYFMTIPVNHISDFSVVEKAIYTKIRKAFSFKDKKEKIGLILCGDVNGTRSGLVDQLGYQNPHFHGLLILPKSLAPENTFSEIEMLRRIRRELGNHKETPSILESSKKIYIKRFDPSQKSLFQTISYITKADTNFVARHAENFKYSTYPYDNKLNNISNVINFEDEKVRDFVFKAHLFPEEAFSNGKCGHLTSWQRHHRCLYENAIGEEEKARVKRKFLSQVRPTSSPSLSEKRKPSTKPLTHKRNDY
jgi:hypothetical protein